MLLSQVHFLWPFHETQSPSGSSSFIYHVYSNMSTFLSVSISFSTICQDSSDISVLQCEPSFLCAFRNHPSHQFTHFLGSFPGYFNLVYLSEVHQFKLFSIMANRWGNSGNSVRLYFLGFQNSAVGDLGHEMKRCLLLGRKVMTNLYSIFKRRDISLPNKGPSSQGYGFSSGHVWM